MADDIILSIRGLCNAFGSQVVHDKLNLDVKRGEILGVVGGSGTGKSVLLRSIIGLQHYTAGTISIRGQNIEGLSPLAAKDMRAHWGVLFQNGALFTSLTVRENIEVPIREFAPMDETLMAEIAAYKLAMVGLPPEAANKFPSELSGGMRKRAGVARALALDPDILFLDEPTSGLDPIAAADFDSLIKSLQETLGFTVFLITHDLDTLHTICDRVAVLADHKVLITAPIKDLLNFPHPWVKDYFSGPRGRAALDSTALSRG